MYMGLYKTVKFTLKYEGLESLSHSVFHLEILFCLHSHSHTTSLEDVVQ